VLLVLLRAARARGAALRAGEPGARALPLGIFVWSGPTASRRARRSSSSSRPWHSCSARSRDQA
jgi:hypothetical protein